MNYARPSSGRLTTFFRKIQRASWYRRVLCLFNFAITPQERNLTLAQLPRQVVVSNWKIQQVKEPAFAVRDYGDRLDEVANDFVDKFMERKDDSERLTFAGEAANLPGETRTLRAIKELIPGHIVAIDVILHRTKENLLVKFAFQKRTLLPYLRSILYCSIFLGILCVSAWAYLTLSDAKTTWTKEYAEKYAPILYSFDNDGTSRTDEVSVAFLTQRTLEGYYSTNWETLREDVLKDQELLDSLKSYCQKYSFPVEFDKFGNQYAKMYLQYAGSEFAQEIVTRVYLAKCAQEKYYNTYFNFNDSRVLELPVTLGNSRPEFSLDIFFTIEDDRDINKSDAVRRNGGVLYRTDVSSNLRIRTTDWLKELDLENVLDENFSAENDKFANQRLLQLFRKNTKWNPPMTIWQLFRADPRGTLFQFSVVVGIIGFVIRFVGFTCLRLQDVSLLRTCRLIGWPSTSDYDTYAVGYLGAVRDDFFKILPVGKDQIDILANSDV